ncbi:MAG: sigma-54-dependent Fis family transcriptional regulator [Oceanospirillaceae bacterium]|nr:sigma-54-dependent Fis family transcriptional regulator [Oceanospirillaceae bacterium]
MQNNAEKHQQLISESWQRCRKFGLQHDTEPERQSLASADTHILQETYRQLISTTDHAVLPYYDNILNNSPCLILLADSRGHVLNSWGERRFLSVQQKAWFSAGASWREVSTGTNAIGTALAVGQAVQIERDEHFLKRHRYMIGSAAPIYDANNELLAVLDISSDTYMPQAHTLGMVRLMSQSIENKLIFDKYHASSAIVTINTHIDNLDSQWSGLIVFDEQGRVIVTNRRAEQLLDFQLSGLNIEEVLHLPLQTLQSKTKNEPFKVRVFNKYTMYAQLSMPASIGLITPVAFTPEKNKLNSCSKKSPLGLPLDLAQIEFGDAKMQRAIMQGKKVIEKDIPLLIFGETGVGKEVFVSALHQFSSRADSHLVALNCAAIPAELVESELFGYVKGAFTGADAKGSIGLIRQASKGILFLDEIGDMPMKVQARLLRVLQERQVTPLGSTKSYPVDIKLISATHCNLKELVASGLFRKDLFYRINGLKIEIPALRARTDKRALFESIFHKKAQSSQPAISAEIMSLFIKHPWPGNIRQFISVLEVALAMADDEPIENWHLADDFFDDLLEEDTQIAVPLTDVIKMDQSSEFNYQLEDNIVPITAVPMPFSQKIDLDDKTALLDCFNRCNGNLSKTAKTLGVSRNTLYKRLRLLGLK